MTTAKPKHNLRDLIAISLAQVHNLGAGGVDSLKSTIHEGVSEKRKIQYYIRNARALGITSDSVTLRYLVPAKQKLEGHENG